jgi:hypothetical protein
LRRRTQTQSNLVLNTEIDGPALTFDWPAIEIGVGSYEEGPTGLTIIRFPKRATVAVDERGGGPGTINTDLLRLGYSRNFIDAIVFSGGSAYGEETITAVANGLKDHGIRSGDWLDVAVVPGAIIYDFGGRRLNEIYPDKRLAGPLSTRCGREFSRSVPRAPGAWRCRADFSAATPIPAKEARSVSSARPRSPPLWS